MNPKTYTAFLYLEEGIVCQGWSFCELSASLGEVVFNTGMTGYQEVFSDPSYCDQIILFTYPEIGNTGINIHDMEASQCYLKGIIVKNLSLTASSWRSEMSIVNYLIEKKIPHIFGIDTRYLVKYLRSKGVMLGCLSNKQLNSYKLAQQFEKFKVSQNANLIKTVTTHFTYKWSGEILFRLKYIDEELASIKNLHVVVVDFGVKVNILRLLNYYGCCVTVVPASSSYAYIMSKSPDGVLLSNGPGDPMLLVNEKYMIRQLVSANIPIFGICLGHQLLSLALGGLTSKLKFGHRGLNHPSGLYDRVKITSQNHGFFVVPDISFDDCISIISFNLNDNTIAGIIHKQKPCFSVQYHPEASPGPHDAEYLFLHFINVMLACKQ